MTVQTHILGIRHHGPGSARGVLAELERLRPDAVLVEGPADASELIPAIAAEGMSPPVALLGYAADTPALAAFWPFAVFSPEWQAMRWSVAAGVPVEFCDLPVTNVLAHRAEVAEPDVTEVADGEATDVEADAEAVRERISVRTDPIALLADAAGYSDPERWWDDVVELRTDGHGFDAVLEAMTELRQEEPDTGRDAEYDERREAFMRQTIRRIAKQPGVERIVVVCGAWHAPALAGKLPPAAQDSRTLKGIPKVKARVAWVPWTHSRLAFSSGYGAGVVSPGWYHHLFTRNDHVVIRWLTDVAELLRDNDIPVSSAHIIETARLAEALAVMRGRPLPGLAELSEATLAVMCDGESLVADLVHRTAVIGERLGGVPDDSPLVPLQADLTATARSLRLKFESSRKEVVLDLRKPSDLAKSVLLHRLTALGVGWGTPVYTAGTGTFKEGWSLRWQPEFVIDIVLASVWGTTIEAAAVARLTATADRAGRLAEITEALEQALLGAATGAIEPILRALHDRAAIDHDVEHLMAALPALARARRYGDVRGTDVESLGVVAGSLLIRICAALPTAVGNLNDEAAEEITKHIDAVEETVSLLDADDRTRWRECLRSISERRSVHGILVGRCTRLLLDSGEIDNEMAALRLSAALSTGAVPAEKAAWIDGFLGDGGLLLVHDRQLLGIVDDWLAGLPEQQFVDALPLLRRTFGGFDAPVRRSISGRLTTDADARLESDGAAGELDPMLAGPVVTVLAGILEGSHG